MGYSEIVDTISKKLVPFILLFGMYLVSYGHLSPGGGFQGGVVLASGAMLLCLTRGVEMTMRIFPLQKVRFVEIGAFFLILLIGLIGMIAGRKFLGNFLPLGRPGEVPSAGFIFFLNLLIGVKVGAGVTLICFYLFKE